MYEDGCEKFQLFTTIFIYYIILIKQNSAYGSKFIVSINIYYIFFFSNEIYSSLVKDDYDVFKV